jgi:hypothetical protein
MKVFVIFVDDCFSVSDVFPPFYLYFLMMCYFYENAMGKFIISFSSRIALGWAEVMYVSRA